MWWTTLTRKLEQAEKLDPAVDKVTAAVNAVLPAGLVKDALHGRFVGHPIHPILVALPIGLWSGVSLLDYLGDDGTRRAAKRLVGAGVLLALPTAATGYADWSELGAFRRPRPVGLVHASVNVMTVLVYGASWVARARGDERRGRRLALLGAAGLGVGGYLGGHLAYDQGVGVNRNADRAPEPADWTDAAADAEVTEGSLHRVEVDGQPVLLARSGGEVHAVGAVCSHYGGPLADGELTGGGPHGDEPCVVCPWHGSRFRLRDGAVAGGPATVSQQAFAVRTLGDRIQVKAVVD